MEENNTNPFENTPTSSRLRTEEASGGGGDGGGSGVVNDVRNPSVGTWSTRDQPNNLPVEAQQSVMFNFSAHQMGFPSPTFTQPPLRRRPGRPRGSSRSPLGGPTSSPSPVLATVLGGEEVGYGTDMNVHEILIGPREDVYARLVLLANKSNRTITVISGVGSVRSTEFHSPGSASRSYEGVFQILNLNGTLINYATQGGSRNITGSLTASLVRPNGEVFGGRFYSMEAFAHIEVFFVSFVQVRRPSIPNIQFPRGPPPPRPAGAVQFQVSNPNVSTMFQQAIQAQDALSSSLRLDPLNRTNTPVTSVARNTNASTSAEPESGRH